MKKGGGSKSTIIIGPSKSVLVYALHSLEYVLGLRDFGCSCQNYIIILLCNKSSETHKSKYIIGDKNIDPAMMLINSPSIYKCFEIDPYLKF